MKPLPRHGHQSSVEPDPHIPSDLGGALLERARLRARRQLEHLGVIGWPEFERLGVLNEEFGDGFELAAQQAGLTNPEAAVRANGDSEVTR
jgi:hypothetical protein